MPRRPVQPSVSVARKNATRVRDWQRHRKGKPIPPCQLCGSTLNVEMHHEDYIAHRFKWLCRKCHGAMHGDVGRPAPADWTADIRAAVARFGDERNRTRGK